jgi:hypothetical protein
MNWWIFKKKEEEFPILKCKCFYLGGLVTATEFEYSHGIDNLEHCLRKGLVLKSSNGLINLKNVTTIEIQGAKKE